MSSAANAFEFVVDTEKDGTGRRKSAVPFHLQRQSVHLKVLWGDGEESLLSPAMYSVASAEASEHEYAKPGRYRISVQIEGCGWDKAYISTLDCQDAEFETAEGFNSKTECIRLFKKKLVELPVPLPKFKGAWEFFTTSPSKWMDGIPVKDNFSYLFLHCSSLERICGGLFRNNTEATHFAYAFYGCRSLQEIPSNLFKGCTNVLSFAYCFFGCSCIASIPEELFACSHKAKNFKGCFKDCSRLAAIPERLFSGNPNAELFTECFQNCTSIESIPERLFSRTPAAISFSRTFENCSSLQAVPECLFRNMGNAAFFKEVFSKTAIRDIPENLFSECRNANTFAYAFAWCPILQSVPGGLFRNCAWTDSFLGCFYGCIALEKVGRELLCGSIFARTLNSMFYGCQSLNAVELDVPLRRIENVNLMFERDDEADRTVLVPRMSATAKLFKMKEEDLGIKVRERMFLKTTLQAVFHSVMGRLKN